jgi:hypothetical protein
VCAMAALVAALVMLASLGVSRHAQAHGGGMGGGVAAAQKANVGLGGCSNNRGKALYDCVAGVIEGMSNEISGRKDPEVKRSLQTAAFQLRAAVNKVQALSAINQCQAVIAGALRMAREFGGNAGGWSAIAGVLARAARLIQTRG